MYYYHRYKECFKFNINFLYIDRYYIRYEYLLDYLSYSIMSALEERNGDSLPPITYDVLLVWYQRLTGRSMVSLYSSTISRPPITKRL